MRRYLRLYRVIGKTFGLWLRPLGAFALLQVRQAISATTLGLDHLVYPATASSRSTGRSSSSAIRAAAPRSCIGCCWEPAIWPLSSCGRCCFRPSRRASCSAASFRGWTGCRRRATTRRTCTTPACAASRPTTWRGFSAPSTVRSPGRISLPGRTPGEVSYRGASSGSTACRRVRTSGSSITTRHAGDGT